MEGVTKPEQAERANGVHTEVSIGRQDPLPVGGFVFHGHYPARSGFVIGCVGYSWTGAYEAFLCLGHVERVTFSTRGSCPGALLALEGVHTEVGRTERLWLLSVRVRCNLRRFVVKV